MYSNSENVGKVWMISYTQYMSILCVYPLSRVGPISISSNVHTISNFSYYISAIKNILQSSDRLLQKIISSEKFCVIIISHIICAKSDCISAALCAQL